MKKVKSNESNKEKKPPVTIKEDDIMRTYFRTNAQGREIIERIELPSTEVHHRWYGNIPSFTTMSPYIGVEFEYYLDGELVGVYILLHADQNSLKYEQKVEV